MMLMRLFDTNKVTSRIILYSIVDHKQFKGRVAKNHRNDLISQLSIRLTSLRSVQLIILFFIQSEITFIVPWHDPSDACL
jgi:hypothetical protein